MLRRPPRTVPRADLPLTYLLGGSTIFLMVIELVSSIFHIYWVSTNYYNQYKISTPFDVYLMSVLCFVFGLLAIIFFFFALLLTSSATSSRSLRNSSWAAGFTSVAAVIAFHLCAFFFTRYGGFPVKDDYLLTTNPTLIDYYNSFLKYGGYGDAPFPADRFPAITFHPRLEQFLQPYYKEEDTEPQYLPSCVIDWSLVEPASSACDLDFSQVADSVCVGSWTAERFKGYWCAEETVAAEDAIWAAERFEDRLAVEERYAVRVRNNVCFHSYFAVHELCLVLLAMEAPGLLVAVVCVSLELTGKCQRRCGDAEAPKRVTSSHVPKPVPAKKRQGGNTDSIKRIEGPPGGVRKEAGGRDLDVDVYEEEDEDETENEDYEEMDSQNMGDDNDEDNEEESQDGTGDTESEEGNEKNKSQEEEEQSGEKPEMPPVQEKVVRIDEDSISKSEEVLPAVPTGSGSGSDSREDPLTVPPEPSEIFGHSTLSSSGSIVTLPTNPFDTPPGLNSAVNTFDTKDSSDSGYDGEGA